MKHTLISWDASYRNFFHLIDGLLYQDYSKDQFELIYVEQRSREFADQYNHDLNLPSLYDRYEEVKNQINIKVIYLDEDASTLPYHLGKSNNAGIAAAQGEIISVLDGDQLFPKDFLKILSQAHDENPRQVLNVYRKMCAYPAGVSSYNDWTKGLIDFKKCLNTCPEKYITLPTDTKNFGPMISARKEWWQQVNGYDTHPIWSTALSKLGCDVNTRLEIATGSKCKILQNTFAVHPWHPIGVGSLRKDKMGKKYFSLQDQLTDWSVQNNNVDYQVRTELADKLYEDNKVFVEELIHSDIEEELKNVIPNDLLQKKIKCKTRHFKEGSIQLIKKVLGK